MKKNINFLLANSCCFISGNPIKFSCFIFEDHPMYIKIKNDMRVEIEKAILNGYSIFMTSLDDGFDLSFAEIVLELKGKYPHIKLIGVIAYESPCKKLSNDNEKKYKRILSELDYYRCIFNTFQTGCQYERDFYMLNKSSLVIATSVYQLEEIPSIVNDARINKKRAEIVINCVVKQGKKIILINP